MTFREGGQFEGGRVRTSRGMVGRPAAIGGGGLFVVLVVVLLQQLTGVDVSGLVQGAPGAGGQPAEVGVVEACTAAEANERRDCRLSATVQSLDAFWVPEMARHGVDLPLPEVTSFTDAVQTGCGSATSATGPFYCPADQGIYLDLSFFDLLESRFGASGGPLAEMYVQAHEYGHHIQNVAGYFDRADRSQSGPTSDSVRLELQADCLAGMWVGHASHTVDPDTGVIFLEPITRDELAQALSAAAAVGDDHIQASAGGSVDPHTWTHGSSEQRERWFTTGYQQGSLAACDTFAASSL